MHRRRSFIEKFVSNAGSVTRTMTTIDFPWKWLNVRKIYASFMVRSCSSIVAKRERAKKKKSNYNFFRFCFHLFPSNLAVFKRKMKKMK